VGLLLFGNEMEAIGQSETMTGNGFKEVMMRMKGWFQGNF
jgi:hypothetical protein